MSLTSRVVQLSRAGSLGVGAWFLMAMCIGGVVQAEDAAKKKSINTGAPSLASWLPDDVVGFVRVNNLAAHFDAFTQSDIVKALREMDGLKAAIKRGPLKKLAKGRKKIRDATGLDAVEVLKKLVGREVIVGVRLARGFPEVAVIGRAASAKELEATLASLRAGVSERAGFVPDGQKQRYRGRTIETFGQVALVSIDASLAVSNSTALLEKIVDLAAGKGGASVTTGKRFRKLHQSGDAPFAQVAVRIRELPNFTLPERFDNAFGALLARGWLGALESSDVATAALDAGADGLRLRLGTWFDQEGLDESYAAWFPRLEASAAKGAADSLVGRLQRGGALLVLQFSRHLVPWWDGKDSFLHPKGIGDLSNFEQVMGVVFGGRQFGDDVLSWLGPVVTFVAQNQSYERLKTHPQPALPGFAVIFQLQSTSDETQRAIVGAFQRIVSLVSADAAQKRKSERLDILLRMDKLNGGDVHYADIHAKHAGTPGIVANFSPALIVTQSHAILSSCRELAGSIAAKLKKGQKVASETTAVASDRLLLDARALESILRKNLSFLVTAQMTKEGKDKAEAERDILGLLELLSWVRDLRLETHSDERSFTLDAKLNWRRPKASTVGKAGRL